MSEINDVVGGEPVESAWGNSIRDRSTMRYVDLTDLQTQEPLADEGSLRYTDSDGLYLRRAGGWVLVPFDAQVDAKLKAGPWVAANLQNGWVNFGAGEQQARYRLLAGDEMVHVQGVIKDGSTTLNSEIFTLDIGYRPFENIQIPCSSQNGYAQMKINLTGVVAFRAGGNADFAFNTIFAVGS